MASVNKGIYDVAEDYFSSLKNARVPIQYMASLFSAGDEALVEAVYKKVIAVRIYKRAEEVGDIPQEEVKKALSEGNTTPEEAEAIFRLTSLPTFEERFVLPPMEREVNIEAVRDPFTHKREAGTGFRREPERGW